MKIMTLSFTKTLLILILSTLNGVLVSAEAVVFVDQNAPGPPDGNTWATAYPTIQQGIDDAAISGQPVWVADGVYNEAIQMRDAVRVFGGFEGFGGAEENEFDQRDFSKNAMIIDATGLKPADALPPFHTVRFEQFPATIRFSTLDGFAIIGGKADGVGNDSSGGGIIFINADETNSLRNVLIIGNEAANRGGGIYLENSSPIIENVDVTGNSADFGGGIFYSASNADLVGAVVNGNISFSAGGGIFIQNSVVDIIHGTLTRNVSLGNGGGVFFDSDSTSRTMFIVNTIVDRNSSHALWENTPTADIVPEFSLFNANAGGDFFDEGAVSLTGAGQINASIASAEKNADGDPDFKTDLQGTWSDSEPPTFDPTTNRTRFTAENPVFPGNNALLGTKINPNIMQRFQTVITSNTMTTVLVVGDFTGLASPGDTFELIDLRINDNSRAIDMGVDPGASIPALDPEGRMRGINHPGYPFPPFFAFERSFHDIGAFEAAPTVISPVPNRVAIPWTDFQ